MFIVHHKTFEQSHIDMLQVVHKEVKSLLLDFRVSAADFE